MTESLDLLIFVRMISFVQHCTTDKYIEIWFFMLLRCILLLELTSRNVGREREKERGRGERDRENTIYIYIKKNS